ncbi:hypothetical protein CAPI_03070 [Corynebacterium capitovis DSM 44611]|uniref:DUF4233 domain-containing protein n=1 Tax=Corynebacterium capitovis TaxID=131081 RepID=UPI00038121E8|nr:DUF4233 domain-containing protein [Corynebacterium capitovis]WKD57176.1 hypothetical protein CAPI_03070 [Corynebacterium capitovis DSM 44611]
MKPRRDNPVSPLGMGGTPVKDPLQGLTGVLSGTLVMEAITILLILLVVLKIDGGAHWTTFNWAYIAVIGLAHVVFAFMQKRPWALWADLALQVPLVFGFFIHWSVSAVGIMFAIVWYFIVKLRAEMIERLHGGYLVTQHLGTADGDRTPRI